MNADRVLARLSDRNRSLVGLGRSGGACGWPTPDSPAVGGDVDLGGVVGVEEDAVAPLEVVALDPFPMASAVGRAIGRGVKAGDIERVGMIGVDGQVVDMLRLREEGSPCLAAVVLGINAAVAVGILAFLSPCRQVKALRVAWVDLEAGGAGDA